MIMNYTTVSQMPLMYIFLPRFQCPKKSLLGKKEKLEKLTFRKAVINVDVKCGLIINVLSRTTIN